MSFRNNDFCEAICDRVIVGRGQSLKKVRAVAVGVVVTTVATVALTATSAQASESQCGVEKVGTFCHWTGTNYSGAFSYTRFSSTRCYQPSAPFRSGLNWLEGGVRVWSGTNCTGSTYIFANNGQTVDQTGDIGFAARSYRKL